MFWCPEGKYNVINIFIFFVEFCIFFIKFYERRLNMIIFICLRIYQPKLNIKFFVDLAYSLIDWIIKLINEK
jgi:hypothetical protein